MRRGCGVSAGMIVAGGGDTIYMLTLVSSCLSGWLSPRIPGPNREVVVVERLIRKRELCEQLQVSKSTLDRWVSQGHLQPPLRLGPRVVAWPSSVIDAWLADKSGSSGSHPGEEPGDRGG